ncbi:hypothetical protein TIFTF001_014031 [Ficus carica]|uniref:Uncharacterized protein n=1 Tax=Ficus carica TaxID=3494 RepID=A0AA88A5D1_FICCA|nr:hypothetical protein TIFTF001_014031 [Ficus carica]
MVKGDMQKKRRSAFHVEGTREFQHGDDIERGREWRREICMDKGLEKYEKYVDAHAQELGCQLAEQR